MEAGSFCTQYKLRREQEACVWGQVGDFLAGFVTPCAAGLPFKQSPDVAVLRDYFPTNGINSVLCYSVEFTALQKLAGRKRCKYCLSECFSSIPLSTIGWFVAHVVLMAFLSHFPLRKGDFGFKVKPLSKCNSFILLPAAHKVGQTSVLQFQKAKSPRPSEINTSHHLLLAGWFPCDLFHLDSWNLL